MRRVDTPTPEQVEARIVELASLFEVQWNFLDLIPRPPIRVEETRAEDAVAEDALGCNGLRDRAEGRIEEDPR